MKSITLRALERKGYLTREDMKSRALRPTALGGNGAEVAVGSTGVGVLPANDDDLVEIQVLGRVAAGLPLFAEEHVIDTVRIDRSLPQRGTRGLSVSASRGTR